MSYLRQQSSSLVPSSDLKQFSSDQFPSVNYHTTTTNPSDFTANDEPIYYYTIAQENVENLPIPSINDGWETKRLHSYRSYDDVHMNQCRHKSLLKRNTSTPWMTSPSRESDAYRPDSTINQNCHCCCCIDRFQNLTTTFQSRSDDVWQTEKSYYEEEVVIVLRDEVERVGFSIGCIIPGNHGAIINSVLSGMK